MKWENRIATLASIDAKGGLTIPARRKLAHVADLAASIGALGDEPIHPIVCVKRRGAWLLVAGRDRLAALMELGVKSAPIRVVVDATPEQLAKVERDENAHRRPLTQDEVATLKAVVFEDLQERKGGHVPASQTVKREQRKVQAAAEGVKPETIKKREQREKVREGAAARMPTDVNETNSEGCTRLGPPSPIETFGNALPERVRDEVVPVLTALKDVLLHVGRAKAAAQALMLVSFDTAAHGRIEDASAELQGMVRGLTPSHACPYCIKKGVDKRCAACGGNGYVTKAVFASAPAELRGGWTDEERAAGLDAEPASFVKGGTITFPHGPQDGPALTGTLVVTKVDRAAGAVTVDAPKYAKPKSRGKVVIVDEQGVEHEVTE